ncbi:MAG TPA: ABC transporter permease [Solirubrobacteraceae bacterium]|nr:ABC transporter permease [Solirubrobacteraceae bacterium]
MDDELDDVERRSSVSSRLSPPDTIRLQATKGFTRLLAPAELWRYRDVALQLAMRDITVRYRQTFLGAAWAILQPLVIMVVFSVVFGSLAHVSSGGAPYALFSLSGLVPWTFFANALLMGSDSLVSNSALVSKIYFPRIFIPAGVVAAGTVDFAIALVILFVVVGIGGGHLSLGLLVLPLLIAITVAAALGVSTGLAALNVRYRDVRYAVPFTVQLWLFATPVAYSSSLVPEPWRTVFAVNPMVGVVEGFRWAMLDRPHAPWALIAVSAGTSLGLLVAGLAYFGRVERGFADFV